MVTRQPRRWHRLTLRTGRPQSDKYHKRTAATTQRTDPERTRSHKRKHAHDNGHANGWCAHYLRSARRIVILHAFNVAAHMYIVYIYNLWTRPRLGPWSRIACLLLGSVLSVRYILWNINCYQFHFIAPIYCIYVAKASQRRGSATNPSGRGAMGRKRIWFNWFFIMWVLRPTQVLGGVGASSASGVWWSAL